MCGKILALTLFDLKIRSRFGAHVTSSRRRNRALSPVEHPGLRTSVSNHLFTRLCEDCPHGKTVII